MGPGSWSGRRCYTHAAMTQESDSPPLPDDLRQLARQAIGRNEHRQELRLGLVEWIRASEFDWRELSSKDLVDALVEEGWSLLAARYLTDQVLKEFVTTDEIYDDPVFGGGQEVGTAEERKSRLAQQVRVAVTDGFLIEEQSDTKAIVVRGKPLNHRAAFLALCSHRWPMADRVGGSLHQGRRDASITVRR